MFKSYGVWENPNKGASGIITNAVEFVSVQISLGITDSGKWFLFVHSTSGTVCFKDQNEPTCAHSPRLFEDWRRRVFSNGFSFFWCFWIEQMERTRVSSEITFTGNGKS